MSIDRDTTLKNAESLLREGRLDDAIAEYERLVGERPRDWESVLALGDLHARAGNAGRAVTELTRVADYHYGHGDFARAAEIYRQALAVAADHDPALRGGSGQQGAARSGPPAVDVDLGEVLATLDRLLVPLDTIAPDLDHADAPVDRVAHTAVHDEVEDEFVNVDDEVPLETSQQTGDNAPAAVAATPPPDLETVFAEMRARATGAAAGDPGREHYNRAQQQLLEGHEAEAIADLQVAARTPALRFTAAAQLGRLHVERREFELGIEWLERAAEAPAPGPDDGTAVLYDLAGALEQVGEGERALAVLLEVNSLESGYRDVRERIDRLSRARLESGGA